MPGTPTAAPADTSRGTRVTAEGLERLVRDHGEVVWRFATGLLGDPVEAEDVAQETFVRVHRSLEGFRGESSVRTWILSICRNACIDRLRRRRAPVVSLEALREDGHDPAPPVDDPAEGHAVRALVARGLARLPSEEREAFVLVDVLGLSGVEAAETCGIPPTTLRSRLHRAHDKLVTELEKG